ncbi:MAG: hypothetical protein HZA66_01105 [Rhodopseudomonas palustris]|uniref:Uncharacterized protein n=1 Tax=Rhodopseudomonas palustris TaxID=1076 RepID=A0A933VSV5_RHOPL|nr:hypothetical protein [Rhodopseudomonas palustris]
MKPQHAGQFRDLSPDDMEFIAAAEWAQAAALADEPKDLVMKSASEMHARAKLKRMLLSQVPTKH